MPGVSDRPGTGNVASPVAALVAPATAQSALFRQRNFAALWWGQVVSLTGERCAYLALVAMVAEQSRGSGDARSASLLSLLAKVMLAPVLLFAPFVGARIDRWNLRHVVVTCDILRGAIVLLVPVVYRLSGEIAPVYLMLFLLFTCGVFFLPAKSSLTPEIVPGTQLLAANTWLTVAGIVATGIGMLGGGWLVDHWGWVRALELNGVAYWVSAGSMLAIRYTPRPRTPAASLPGMGNYLQQLREGWSVVRDTPTIAVALGALAIAWWSGGFLHVAGNVHVQRATGVPGVERMGWLFAVLGVGGGLSAWWINTRAKQATRPRWVSWALVMAGAGLLLFAVSRRLPVMMAAAFLIGLAVSPILLLGETMLQQGSTPGMRGRVFASRDFFVRAVLLVSVTAAAWLTHAWGAPHALMACGGGVVAAGLLVLGVGSRRGRAGPTARR